MENASHAFLDAVRKSMRQIRAAIGATTINPALLTAAEKLHDGYRCREETNGAILTMDKKERRSRRSCAASSRGLYPKGASRSEVGHLPRSQQLARSLLALAGRAMGGGAS